jgi:hypothetical protein
MTAALCCLPHPSEAASAAARSAPGTRRLQQVLLLPLLLAVVRQTSHLTSGLTTPHT